MADWARRDAYYALGHWTEMFASLIEAHGEQFTDAERATLLRCHTDLTVIHKTEENRTDD